MKLGLGFYLPTLLPKLTSLLLSLLSNFCGSRVHGTATVQVAMGFLLCEWSLWLADELPPSHSRIELSSYWQLELVELWKVSRAGLEGHELKIYTAGNFWSVLFYQATPAPLKAVWNLVFILFWQRQQHSELFGLDTHSSSCTWMMFSWHEEDLECVTPLLQPLLHTSLPSPRVVAACAPKPSADPAQLRNLASDCWKKSCEKVCGEIRKLNYRQG